MTNNELKQNIKFAKTLLSKKLKVEEVALLARNTKDLSDTDVQLLAPLSRYKHWLVLACENAKEALEMAPKLGRWQSAAMQQDVENYVNARCQGMNLYYRRAMAYYREYQAKMRELGLIDSPQELPVNHDAAKSA